MPGVFFFFLQVLDQSSFLKYLCNSSKSKVHNIKVMMPANVPCTVLVWYSVNELSMFMC